MLRSRSVNMPPPDASATEYARRLILGAAGLPLSACACRLNVVTPPAMTVVEGAIMLKAEERGGRFEAPARLFWEGRRRATWDESDDDELLREAMAVEGPPLIFIPSPNARDREDVPDPDGGVGDEAHAGVGESSWSRMRLRLFLLGDVAKLEGDRLSLKRSARRESLGSSGEWATVDTLSDVDSVRRSPACVLSELERIGRPDRGCRPEGRIAEAGESMSIRTGDDSISRPLTRVGADYDTHPFSSVPREMQTRDSRSA